MSDNNTQGFGLSIISLALLAGAFIVTFYLDNAILGSILAFVSAILAFASYFEARRAGGPARLSLTIIIITMLGAIFSLVWTISVTQQAETENIIIEAPEAPAEPDVNSEKKLEELEEKVEELEEDSTD
jgi:predicted PurR-regulated permease PerM